MNAIVLAYKPSFITSNAFLHTIKRKLGVKKAGFSGTLDPFAQGSLVIGIGAYTKLLPFIPTEPKVYEATLWLGVESKSLDTEHITAITSPLDSSAPRALRTPFATSYITRLIDELQGEISYTPPSFSAKKIHGKRAYELARKGEQVALQTARMRIYELTLLCYNHPFIHFRASVSKGAYIRSLGEILAGKLGIYGTLSSLKRVSEGGLCASRDALRFLSPFEILPFPILLLTADFVSVAVRLATQEPIILCGLDCVIDCIAWKRVLRESFLNGKKIVFPQSLLAALLRELARTLPSYLHAHLCATKSLESSALDSSSASAYHNAKVNENTRDTSGGDFDKSGVYIVQFDDFFSIIRLYRDGSISYLLNRIDYAHTL